MKPFEPMPTERAALIERIKKVAFTPTRFQAGYDERVVDDFLDAIIASLRGSSAPMAAARIRDDVFPQTKFKGGYRVADVDEFRRLVADAVEQMPNESIPRDAQLSSLAGQLVPPPKLLWRERPRPSMLRGDSRLLLLYGLAFLASWVSAARFGWSALTGADGTATVLGRIEHAAICLGCAAVGAALSLIAWLYARRPLTEADDRDWGRSDRAWRLAEDERQRRMSEHEKKASRPDDSES